MSLTLVYIGAAAELAPAASLRALAGGGAVFVPAGLDGGLLRLVGQAADPGEGRVLEVDAGDDAASRTSSPGPRRPRHRRAGRAARPAARARAARPAAAAGVSVTTGPRARSSTTPCSARSSCPLKRIVDVLRVECPWDREQTARDIISYTIEEVYELADAIAGDDLAAEHGELGDLLLQVVLLALMLHERDAGDLGSVAHDIEVKLIRRHPHIFADAVAETAADVKGRWERIKVEQEGREGIFHDVPSTFHALLYARKLQQRAASVGFDWSSAAEAFPKIAEEHGELAELFAEAAARDGGPADPPPAATRACHTRSATCSSPSSTWRGCCRSTLSWRCARRPSASNAGSPPPPPSPSRGRRWAALDFEAGGLLPARQGATGVWFR